MGPGIGSPLSPPPSWAGHARSIRSMQWSMLMLSVGLVLCCYLFWLQMQEMEAVGGRLDALEAKVHRPARKPRTAKPEEKPDGDK